MTDLFNIRSKVPTGMLSLQGQHQHLQANIPLIQGRLPSYAQPVGHKGRVGEEGLGCRDSRSHRDAWQCNHHAPQPFPQHQGEILPPQAALVNNALHCDGTMPCTLRLSVTAWAHASLLCLGLAHLTWHCPA